MHGYAHEIYLVVQTCDAAYYTVQGGSESSRVTIQMKAN